MRSSFIKTSCAVALAMSSSATLATDINVTADVIYGQGTITVDGVQQQKDLWMDAFVPAGEATSDRAAIVLTHGGSFLRGNPRDSYQVDGAQSTSMNEYCAKFAAQGHACFAISYRLGGEIPVPSGDGYTEADFPLSMAAGLDQFNYIRHMMGLRTLDANVAADIAEVEDTVKAAAEDLRTAINYIRDNATSYNVDPEKVVVGGFSAGATTSLNVVHSLNVPVAGVFMLSVVDATGKASVADSTAPLLIFQAQNDLNAMYATGPRLLNNLDRIDADYEFAWVPGFGHFYPSGAVSLGGDGTRVPVEQRIYSFIERVTQ